MWRNATRLRATASQLSADTTKYLQHDTARQFCSIKHQALHYMQSIRQQLPVSAQRMLDDGLLDHCDRAPSPEQGRAFLNHYLAQCRSPAERHEVVVSFTYLLTRFRNAHACCPECLFAKERCICSKVKRVKTKHKLWLVQHVGEYGRSNNTGSILCLVAGAERTIRGVREQQDRLLQHIEQKSDSTAILFPNSSSMTLQEFNRERVVKMGEPEEQLTLVLLDGTSRQAKNFDGFMPKHIPRVRIRNTNLLSWLDPIRRQTEEHRVCTAQAAAMILEELGDVEACRAIEDAVKLMVSFAVSNRYTVPSPGRKMKRHASSLLFTS